MENSLTASETATTDAMPTASSPSVSVSTGVVVPASTVSTTPTGTRLSPEEISQIAAAVAGIIHPTSTTMPPNPLSSGSQAGVSSGSAASTVSVCTTSTGNSG